MLRYLGVDVLAPIVKPALISLAAASNTPCISQGVLPEEQYQFSTTQKMTKLLTVSRVKIMTDKLSFVVTPSLPGFYDYLTTILKSFKTFDFLRWVSHKIGMSNIVL